MPGTWRSQLKSLEFPGLMPSECVSRSYTTLQKNESFYSILRWTALRHYWDFLWTQPSFRLEEWFAFLILETSRFFQQVTTREHSKKAWCASNLPITQDDSKHIFQDSNSEASPPIQHILSPTFLEASVETLQPVEWWEASPSRKARKEHWPRSDSWLGHESVAPTIGCCGANCQPSAITKTTKTGETSLATKGFKEGKMKKNPHSALQSTSNYILTFLV